MKMVKRILGMFLILSLITVSLSSCGKSNSITGMWYNEDGEVLNVQEDGTYNYEREYGTGTWKILDDKTTIEFKDFYGETTNIEIIEEDIGVKIKYHGEYFYKDAYPSDEEISENKEKNAQTIDAFAGLSYEVTGISPYCQLTINNQGCSEEVRQYVSYQLDKERYANGDTAVITATLNANTGDSAYKLESTTSNYKITGQSEYLTSVDGYDLTKLKAELSDYITACFAKAQTPYWSELFGKSVYDVHSVSKTDGDVYFSSLKLDKNAENIEFVNRLSFTYKITYKTTDGTEVFYACISAVNIMKTADGSIKWGSENADDFDFIAQNAEGSIENCVTTLIMCNKDNFNISKVAV